MVNAESKHIGKIVFGSCMFLLFAVIGVVLMVKFGEHMNR